jgi:hypothetical protein
MASTSINVRDYHTEVPGKLTDDNTTWLFPQINSTNSHGKKTEWRIAVKVFDDDKNTAQLPIVSDDAFIKYHETYLDNGKLDDNIRGWIKVDSRIDGGCIRKSVATIIHSGKNIGRSSETNVVCQALRDAYSLHNKQVKKAVTEAKVGNTERFPPMLAQVLSQQKSPIDYAAGVYVQRKFDGVRSVTTMDVIEDGDNVTHSVIMYSRKKNLYPGFGYIKDELKPVLDMYWGENRKLYLDGEIYKHGTSLQVISGDARREAKPGDAHYNYMIYDCFIANEPNLTYTERKAILDEIFGNFNLEYAKHVETFKAITLEEVTALYDGFIVDKFEGAMVRLDKPYKYSNNDHHSKILLKMKPTFDAEYEIVRWETGTKGKAAGAVMIVAKTADRTIDDVVVPGIEFPITPAMEIPDRMALAVKMSEINIDTTLTHFEENYKGKPLIVYFDDKSDDNVPLRARTKMEVRNWE